MMKIGDIDMKVVEEFRQLLADRKATSERLDADALRDLKLYADNTNYIHQYMRLTEKNLSRKLSRGEYETHKAVRAMLYAANYAARSYHNEHCSSKTKWHETFPYPVRVALAVQYVDDFEYRSEV